MQKIQRIENSVNCVKDNVNLLDQGGSTTLVQIDINYVFSKRNHQTYSESCKEAFY